MMGFRPRQGNLWQVLRLFKSHPRYLKTSLRFPLRCLNKIIDYFCHQSIPIRSFQFNSKQCGCPFSLCPRIQNSACLLVYLAIQLHCHFLSFNLMKPLCLFFMTKRIFCTCLLLPGNYQNLMHISPLLMVSHSLTFESRCEKTGLRGFRPGPTQTGLYNHTRWLEARNFGFRK